MPQTAEHPTRTNQVGIKDQELTTTTTTMEHVDPTEIDVTLRGLKKSRVLVRQSFYISTTSPGSITPVASPNAGQLTPQKFLWLVSLGGIRQSHSVSKAPEEQVVCLGDTIEIIFSWPLSQELPDPEPTSSLGEGFVVERAEHPPEWLRRTGEALQSLLTLPENWDSYGARPIEPRAVHAAIELLRSIVQLGTPQPVVVPTNRGGIQIEWHTRGIDLEIEIMADREVRVLYENPQENAEREFELGPDLKPLTDLTAKVSRPR